MSTRFFSACMKTAHDAVPQHWMFIAAELLTSKRTHQGWCACRWVEVSEEVQEAVQAGLPGLSEQEVQAQLCQALLCCAHFNLAKQYLTGWPKPLPHLRGCDCKHL